jgi:hypothetical protein
MGRRTVADEDWFGPFAGLTRHHITVLVLYVGGAFFLTAGLIGYEAGRQDVRLPRWFEGPLWDEVILGLALLVAGVVQYRRLPPRK